MRQVGWGWRRTTTTWQFSRLLYRFFSASISHWGILIIQNLQEFMIEMVILRAQPFTSLMADLLQDNIGLLSQMKTNKIEISSCDLLNTKPHCLCLDGDLITMKWIIRPLLWQFWLHIFYSKNPIVKNSQNRTHTHIHAFTLMLMCSSCFFPLKVHFEKLGNGDHNLVKKTLKNYVKLRRLNFFSN